MTTTNALDGLLFIRNGDIGSRWNFPDAVGSSPQNPAGIGNAVNVAYSFLQSAPGYVSSSDFGFQAFDSSQMHATRQVLAFIESVANLHFTEVSSGGQITFGASAQPTGQGGYAYNPSYLYSFNSEAIVSVTEREQAGDVWINNSGWNSTDWNAGNQGYFTLIHEIGHALGLKHSFDEGNDGFALASSVDNEAHTVMSYTPAPNSYLLDISGSAMSYSWLSSPFEPTTLMPLDIQALQYLYGANRQTNAGNTSYHWEKNAEILETLWDGDGQDTLDCSNQVLTCRIDLQAGHYSSIGLRQTDAELRSALDLPSWFTAPLPSDLYNGSNNLAIASGVVIENATGGSGKDWLSGNTAANRLLGNAGNDTLLGNAGNDTLVGGLGRDVLRGGAGADVFDFNKLTEMSTRLANTDSIADFSRKTATFAGDKIDLRTLDAKAGTTINDAFTFIGNAAFDAQNASGQLRYQYNSSGNYGVLSGSTDADSAAEFVIKIAGISTISNTDFYL